MAIPSYRKALFGQQTLAGESNRNYQREGQVGAVNIFGGAPRQAQAAPAAQPNFASLQAAGQARPAPAPTPAAYESYGYAQPQYTLADDVIRRLRGMSEIDQTTIVPTGPGDGPDGGPYQGGTTGTGGTGSGPEQPNRPPVPPYVPPPGPGSPTPPPPDTPPDVTPPQVTPPPVTPPPGGGAPTQPTVPLPNYLNLVPSDQEFLDRVNAMLAGMSVRGPSIQAVGGIGAPTMETAPDLSRLVAPTMEAAARGPEGSQALQAQLLASLQSALTAPSRYDTETFRQIRGAAEQDLAAQFAQEQRALQEQLAARGLRASSVAAREGESLGERQARARADLVTSLLREQATTYGADRAAALAAAQQGLAGMSEQQIARFNALQNQYASEQRVLQNVADQQISRFNALQNQYANALSEGRMQEALRIENEAGNLQRGIQSVQNLLNLQMNAAQLQQGGSLGMAQLSLQERDQLIGLFRSLYGEDWYNKIPAALKTKLGL